MTMESGAGGGPTEATGCSPLTCFVPGFLIAVAIAVGGGLVAVRCIRGATPADSYSTRVEALPAETPVFLSDPGIYLVRLPEGVVALDHNEARHEDTVKGCVIRYRETLERAGHRGLFRSDCTGTIFDLMGVPLEGPAPPMKRHPITVDGDRVRVDFKVCMAPGEGNAVVACRP